MNQAELQALAEARIQDAKALIDGGRADLGYYIAGYAVEMRSQILHAGKDGIYRLDLP